MTMILLEGFWVDNYLGRDICDVSVISIYPDITSSPIQVKPGESLNITISLNPSRWGGGETIEISIGTSSGNRYYTMVSLT